MVCLVVVAVFLWPVRIILNFYLEGLEEKALWPVPVGGHFQLRADGGEAPSVLPVLTRSRDEQTVPVACHSAQNDQGGREASAAVGSSEAYQPPSKEHVVLVP